MSEGYTKAKEIAGLFGYEELTLLQDKAFQSEELFSPDTEWMFIIGNTSSGKTLIPLMRFFIQCLEGEHPRMLFAVPYRALASQKFREISEFAEILEREYGLHLNIQISTGEIRSGDGMIRCGNVDVAVIIYEKVFMFASMDDSFLQQYQLLVMDEAGLTQDAARGLKADFILARAKMYPKLSVMALGTPYYDWSKYLQSFQFSCIREDKRPVELKEYPIYVKGSKTKIINHVEEDCKAVSCGPLLGVANRDGERNPVQWWDQIIEDICVYHLEQNHKILIFINNREEVRKLSQRLVDALTKRKVLSRWIDEEQCREYLLDKMKVDREDAENELYGVFDEEDYGAFSYGISYHNAAVSNSVRTLVEDEILNSDGHLRIVCCTETLAYGINSNVDVVIIPNMQKQRPEENNQTSFLRANEYMNYAGRAGRLQGGDSGKAQTGYVYALIRAMYQEEEKEAQQIAWEELQREIREAETIVSRYFVAEVEEKPFYLLSIFPNSDVVRRRLSFMDIENLVKSLPAARENGYDREEDVRIPLKYLLEKKLLREIDYDEDDTENDYQLTDTGAQLTGFVIRQDDFDNLLTAIEKGTDDRNVWVVDILYAILSGQELGREISNSIGGMHKKTLAEARQMMERAVRLFWNERGKISEAFRGMLRELFHVELTEECPELGGMTFNKHDNRCNCIRITAAMLLWTSRHCTVKKMYDWFEIGYPQIQRLAEKVSYHLDIAASAMPIIRLEDGRSLKMVLGNDRMLEIQSVIRDLSNAIYYQISPELCRELECEVADPASALEARKLTRMYVRLSDLSRKVTAGKKLSRKEAREVEGFQQRVGRLTQKQQALYQEFWEVL